jgi:hypothetical protein
VQSENSYRLYRTCAKKTYGKAAWPTSCRGRGFFFFFFFYFHKHNGTVAAIAICGANLWGKILEQLLERIFIDTRETL